MKPQIEPAHVEEQTIMKSKPFGRNTGLNGVENLLDKLILSIAVLKNNS